jgi:beta-lactamase regulating signal transducer with metallopeptidase domain
LWKSSKIWTYYYSSKNIISYLKSLFLNFDSVKSVDNSIIGFSAKECIAKSSLTRRPSNAKKDWEKEDNQQKKRCCDWNEAHSYKSAHKPNWDSSGYENDIKFIKEQMRDKEKRCPDYGYNSSKRHFQVWIIILIVLLVIWIIAVIIAVIVFFVVKKKRSLSSQTRAQNWLILLSL